MNLKDPHTLRIFISSPFNGMELERQRLSRLHWPRLEAALASRGVQLRTVDMRWGITSESSADSQVINICLRELDRSDMFVGFFGQRYGWHGSEDAALQENFNKAMERFPWVDKFRDRSVTELEFLHGHLNHPGQLPAVICFRDKAWDDARRAEGEAEGNKRTIYKFSPESELSTKLMDDLKRRVKETEDQTLGINMCYRHPHDCADLIFDKLWEYLQKTILSSDHVAPSMRQQEELAHSAFMATRRGLFVQDEQGFDKLDTHVTSASFLIPRESDSKVLVLTGESGIGKSALVSNWILHRQSFSSDTNSERIIYHVIGTDKASTDTNSMIIRLLDEIHYHMIGDEYRRPSTRDSAELATQLRLCLLEVGEKHMDKTLVIVLDGLNKLDKGSKTDKPLYWLPRSLPNNVRVILTLVPGLPSSDEELEVLQKEYSAQILSVSPLSQEQKAEVCDEMLRMNSKSLSPDQIGLLINSDRTAHPLYLRVIVEELCVYGNFRQLTKQIEYLLSTEGVSGLFGAVVERLEQDFNHEDYKGNIVQEVLCALCCCKNGITEGEIGIPNYMWAPLFYSIQKYTINRGGLLSFAFDELYEVVRQRFLDTPAKKGSAIGKVIRLFEQPFQASLERQGEPSERCAIELAHLLAQANDEARLTDVIGNILVFDILYSKEQFTLLEYWQSTKLFSHPDAIARRYLKSLDQYLAEKFIEKTDGMEYCNQKGETLTDWEHRILDSLRIWFSTCRLFKGYEIISHRHISFEERRPMNSESERENNLLEIRYALACHYCETERYQKAIELHEKVLEILTRKYEKGETSGDLLGRSYHALGTCYSPSDTHKSEAMYLKASELQSADESTKKSALADTLCCLGVLYMERQDTEKAETYLLEAIKLREEEEVAQLTVNMAYLYNNLGRIYRMKNDYDKAEEFYIKSLKVKEKVMGRMNLDTGYTLLNLGSLNGYRRDYDKCLDYNQQALEVFKATASEHPHFITKAMENCVLALVSADRFKEAEPIYLEAYHMEMAMDTKLAQCLHSIHREMVNYFAREERWDMVGEISAALIESGVSADRDYALVDMADARLSEPPERSQLTTIDSGLLSFPESPMLLRIKLEKILRGPSPDEGLVVFCRDHCEAQSATDVKGMRHLVSGSLLTATLQAHREAVMVLEAGVIYAPENENIPQVLSEAKELAAQSGS